MQHRNHRLFSLALAFCLCFSAFSQGQKTLKIVGSTTFKNALMEPNKNTLEEKTGLKLEIVGNGSSRGIKDLIAGNGDAAMISSKLTAVVEKINEKEPGTVAEKELNALQIAEVQVEIVVHPSNTVKKLTNEQVIDLLAGKVVNWKEVGGADLPVVVVTAQPGDGIRTTIESELLKKTPYASNARQLASALQVAKIIAQLPGAIGCISKKDTRSTVTAVMIEKPVTAPLFLVTKGAPSSEVQKLIAALKNL